MTAKPLPDRDLVRQLLRYDADTGVFTHRHRPIEMFPDERASKVWNTRYAGKVAGSFSHEYRMITIYTVDYAAHRLAWLCERGEPVPAIIDHIDFDPENNRITNLRAATHAQNLANRGITSKNTTGVKGVSKKRNSFTVDVRSKDIRYRRTFATLEEAAEARREAASRLHGEFARHE